MRSAVMLVAGAEEAVQRLPLILANRGRNQRPVERPRVIREDFLKLYVYGKTHFECGRSRGFARKATRETAGSLRVGDG